MLFDLKLRQITRGNVYSHEVVRMEEDVVADKLSIVFSGRTSSVG